MNKLVEVSVEDGKYTVIQKSTGRVIALRYGEEWRDCVGDGLILALAQEVQELRAEKKRLNAKLRKFGFATKG
jgi:ubiquinone biosynthesis protein UbiJ